MVDHLESSCLLQKCKPTRYDRLRMKVRDVAIYIASKADQMCTLSYGKGLNKWQDEKLDGGYTGIRVDCSGFEDLPLDSSFPKLELLALHDRYRGLQIPEGYFGRMEKLKVLHLKRMRFTLPSSMDCLVNLQTLLLIDCHVENIDMIGKLNNLEILDFSESNITELPLSLSQLSRLKQLKVSNCQQLEVIQPGVISRMTKLEELFLDRTFNDWGVGESNNSEEKKSKASISELGYLPCLTCLYLCIPDVRSLPEIQFFNNLKLELFHIVIGHTKWDYFDSDSEKMLSIKTDSINDVWKELRLLERCEDLRLKGTCGVKTVVSKLKTSVHLRYLRLEDNEEVEYLVSELDDSNQETRIINEGYSFKTFKVFEKLKTLSVKCCNKMKYLFSVSIIEGLSNLESIVISNCKMMEAIVVVIENEAPIDQIQFTRLTKLILECLPKLKSFCGKLVKDKGLIDSQSTEIVELKEEEDQANSITPFHCQITFPNLKSVCIQHVENVWHDLLIRNNIEDLTFGGCKKIESVFIVKNNETSEDVFRWVPKSKFFHLRNLPNLKHVWNKDIPYGILITFQSLRIVCLEDCPQLKTFFPHSLTKHLQQLEDISIQDCGIDEIFGKEESELDYSNSKVSFPILKSLNINDADNLEVIWHSGLIVDDMFNLQSVKLDNCKSLKSVFTSNVMSALKRLNKLHIQNCDSLEQVFEIHQMIEPKEHREVASINLRELVLCNLPSLKHVWSNDLEMYQFQDLNDVEVTECPKLITLFPHSIARDLTRQLKRLLVDDSVNVTFMKQELSSVKLNSVMGAFIGLKKMELVGEKVFRELCRLNLPGDLFPALEVLKVRDLHNYERVEEYEASFIEIFSNEENQGVSSNMIQPFFDNLEVVKVENCSRLETLMISSSFCFQNLKQLTVYKCHGLKNLFGLTVVKTLACLKKVKLCECNNVSTVLTKRKDEREEDDEIVFSELEVLKLYDLPNLEMFQSAEWRIRFPKLKTIAIENCPKMMTFSHGIVCTPLLKFIIVQKIYLGTVEPKKLWASNINDTIRQLYDQELEKIPTMVAGVRSDDSNAQLEATTQFRKLLSIKRNRPIEEVIETGVVPRFVEFLMREDFPQLQFEAAQALTNIAYGTSENIKVVIDHGAVPIFVNLLGSPSDDVRQEAVRALGHVAADSPKCRDFVLGHGALQPLLAQLNENAELSMLRNATRTLLKFCEGKPQPHFDQVKPILSALTRLIRSNDEKILTNACCALSYLSDGTNDKIQSVIEAGVGPRLVELLLHQSPSVLIPAVLTVGNIVAGDDMQTQVMINNNILPCLLNLLTQSHNQIIKNAACRIISSITASNEGQIQAVIEANIIAPLVHVLQNAEFDTKKYAAGAISNATSCGSHDQLKYFVSEGCIKPLCDLLICPDPTIVTVCLRGLENILKVGEAEKNLGTTGGVNLYAQMIDDAEGLEKIENLRSHDNTEIYEKAVKILETYWLEERRRDYASKC